MVNAVFHLSLFLHLHEIKKEFTHMHNTSETFFLPTSWACGPIFILIKVHITTKTIARWKGMSEDAKGAIKITRATSMS